MTYSLLILAHVLADFSFQTEKLSKNKQLSFLALMKHLLIVFLTSLILTFYYFSEQLLFVILTITLFHGIIDYCKIYLTWKLAERKAKTGNYKLEIFIVDQILHILVILLTVPLFTLQGNLYLALMYNDLKDIFQWLGVFNTSRVFFITIAASVVIFNFKGSTIITRAVLEKYKSDINNKAGKGKAIGNLERLLIILFVILENYSLIGLLFTAKSLIRFKEIEEKKVGEGFVEYYLLGSITSIFLAVLTGSIINIFKYLW
ncbi:DUF3307 domain-containing protein [Iocasia frigidifontis]|uniref:DUF3307 domain-containing protein n=1 Tax=Iocasia fonsfrigidae TaxID=2682810 RepID=A0A8A7KE49_9FIRM|nr:DUF3307 domain-containing protein [Iocasia fonsfrigidae]QTL99691.1 DUF3307 domain-containing protein [Iocasia fonsfrigidae]